MFRKEESHLSRRPQKNGHSLRHAYPASLRRAFLYACFLGISNTVIMVIFKRLQNGLTPTGFQDAVRRRAWNTSNIFFMRA